MDKNEQERIISDMIDGDLKYLSRKGKKVSREELDNFIEFMEVQLLDAMDISESLLEHFLEGNTSKESVEECIDIIAQWCGKILEIEENGIAFVGMAQMHYLKAHLYPKEKKGHLSVAKHIMITLTEDGVPNKECYWALRGNIALASEDKKEISKCEKVLEKL